MQRVEMSTGQKAQGDFHDANEISALGGYYPIHSLAPIITGLLSSGSHYNHHLFMAI